MSRSAPESTGVGWGAIDGVVGDGNVIRKLVGVTPAAVGGEFSLDSASVGIRIVVPPLESGPDGNFEAAGVGAGDSVAELAPSVDAAGSCADAART